MAWVYVQVRNMECRDEKSGIYLKVLETREKELNGC
jgi:hypothetical protein